MSGQIKLSCPAGGSVTVASADTASNLTATIPAATDTLVNLSSTQTLTNKTLTAAGTNTVEATSGPTSTQLAGQRNKIINGAMMIDQRNAGASISNDTTGTQYSIDRWAIYGTVAAKFTAQQNAGSVTPPVGYVNYLGITSSSAYTVGAAENFRLDQRIEGLNVADLGWGAVGAASVTLSFWVRSSLTGTFGGSLTNSGLTRSYPFTFIVNSANTWEQKTITIAGDTSGTWLTTNGIGLRLMFSLGSGSTYSGTAGSWANAAYISATGATSVVGTSGATFYITGVQLEKGATATPFENRLYGTELALCQRYYWNLSPLPYGNPLAMAVSYSATEADAMVQTPVTMRAAPSLYQATSTNGYVYYFAAATKTVNTVTGISVAGMGISFYLTTTGLTAGQGGLFVVANSTGSLALSAEL